MVKENTDEKFLLTSAQKKKMFAAAFTAYEAMDEIERGIAAAKEQASAAVKVIHDAVQEGTMPAGPYLYKGSKIGVSKRGDAYFFKKFGEQTLEKIG